MERNFGAFILNLGGELDSLLAPAQVGPSRAVIFVCLLKYVCLSFSKSTSTSKLIFDMLHYITISAFNIAAF